MIGLRDWGQNAKGRLRRELALAPSWKNLEVRQRDRVCLGVAQMVERGSHQNISRARDVAQLMGYLARMKPWV